MIHMYNVGVIGDYYSICGFSALGFNIFPVESAEQASVELKKLASDKYGIIFITEQFMQELNYDCAVYDDQTVPCIIPIPALGSVAGSGELRLRRYVEKAIGSDVLFVEE